MIKITIPGRPVPAVRMTQRGKYKKTRAQKYLEYKDYVAWSAKAAGIKKTDKKVATEIDVYINGRAGDWDNYAKAICDGLNGVAWVDDSQIVDGRVRLHNCKRNEQRAEVIIKERIE